MKALLIDDDRMFLERIESLLKKYQLDCELITCTNVPEALKITTEQELDLILLDIYIIDACGLTVLEKVRQKNRDIQILAITASSNRNLLRKSFELGANDFIFKPIEEIEFIVRFKSALRSRKEFLARLQGEELYRKLAETSPDAILVTDLEGKIIFANQQFVRLHRFDHLEQLRGNKITKINSFLNQQGFKLFESRLLDQEILRNMEYSMTNRLGIKTFIKVNASLLKDEKNMPFAFLSMIEDITERKQAEEKLKFLSLHDQLTGLYNRVYFEEELNRLKGSREYPISIICADMDGLKLINDTMGHKQGDELLQACAAILRKAVRTSDVVARIGGDEFAIILPNTDEIASERIVRRLKSNVRKHNSIHKELPLSFSVGSATSRSPQLQPLTKTFKAADNLMYRDKLYRSSSARSQIVNALLAALSERDYIANGHAHRLQKLCEKIGQKAGLSSRQLTDLSLLAQVHDLGKVGIPDSILFKNGPLTEEEWEIMQHHSEKGYRIASSSSDLTAVADLILRHHERWDGKGYPLGLKGEEIPLECRILAIADSFDAMTNKRPYNTPKTRAQAIAEIKHCSGTQFDPQLVELFIQIIEEENCSINWPDCSTINT